MDSEMIPRLVDATVDVFGTMLQRTVAVDAPLYDSAPPRSHVVSTIGFAGTSNGLVSFCCSRNAATAITEALLGFEPGNTDGELADAMGEMANMIAGSFRNRMATSDGAWALTTPFSTIGEDFATAYPPGARRIICPFRMGEHFFHVELVLQQPLDPRRLAQYHPERVVTH
jgi:chemotaxis protein CheX